MNKTKMPRPKSKKALLKLSQNNFKELSTLVNVYSEEALNTDFPEGTLNRNIKDVLIHLHEWHLKFLDWYNIGMGGGQPDMPAKGYTWKTLLALNKQIQFKHKDGEHETAKALLNSSYQLMQKVI